MLLTPWRISHTPGSESSQHSRSNSADGQRSQDGSPLACCCCYCWVAKSYLTLCHLMDCSPPDSSIHRILQARILERVSISLSKGSSWRRDWILVSCHCRWILYHWVNWEVLLWPAASLQIITNILVVTSLTQALLGFTESSHFIKTDSKKAAKTVQWWRLSIYFLIEHLKFTVMG